MKKNKEQRALYVGDTVEGFKVEGIEPGLVQISKDGKAVNPLKVAQGTVPFSKPGVGQKLGRTNQVSEKDVQSQHKEPTQLLRDVGFTPFIDSETGQINGMKVTRISSNSIFSKRGIRVGDVVTEINGKEATGTKAAMALMQEPPETGKFVFKLMRKGRTHTLMFNVK